MGVLAPHTLPRLKPTANCLYPTTLLPLVWPVLQKSCIEHTASTCCLLHSSLYILHCKRCNKQVVLHENRKWRNRVHRKTNGLCPKSATHSLLPSHCIGSSTEWNSELIRLCMLNWSRQRQHHSKSFQCSWTHRTGLFPTSAESPQMLQTSNVWAGVFLPLLYGL